MMHVHTYYRFGSGNTLKDQLATMFADYKPGGNTIRLVIFGRPANDEEYLQHLQLIRQEVAGQFGDRPPVFCYIAQPPLAGTQLAMEVAEIMPESGTTIQYRERSDVPYIIVESTRCKKLYLSGLQADSLKMTIREQADAIFSRLEDILHNENMPISSIVRQWNYIEQIVKKVNGHQHYQEFNDSRTLFYNKTSWHNGYPAATGVGTSCGGVVVDLDAMQSNVSDIEVVALNNHLQVAAHAYSPNVLIGKENEQSGRKATPKFERAKLIHCGNKGVVYVSGAAAIRGEKSLYDVGIEEQTKITLENIEHLLSKEKLGDASISDGTRARLSSIRVYLKEPRFFEIVKRIIEGHYPGLPSVYLIADVCRDELLVEIEGFAMLDTPAS